MTHKQRDIVFPHGADDTCSVQFYLRKTRNWYRRNVKGSPGWRAKSWEIERVKILHPHTRCPVCGSPLEGDAQHYAANLKVALQCGKIYCHKKSGELYPVELPDPNRVPGLSELLRTH